jgi:hypothetical protein
VEGKGPDSDRHDSGDDEDTMRLFLERTIHSRESGSFSRS